MIRKLLVGNFKCIKELEIDLAPLTIFVGPNGSGKTSILESLALMSQCFKKNVPARSNDAIKGELIEYDGLRSILYKGLDDVELCLGVMVDIRTEGIKRAVKKDLEYFSHLTESILPQDRISCYAYMDFLRKLSLDEKEIVEIGYVYHESNSRYLHSFVIDKRLTLSFGYDKVTERYISDPPDLMLKSPAFPPTFQVSNYASNFSSKLVEALKNELSKVYYLSTERGSIPWTYATRPEKHSWVGKRGEYSLEILAELMRPEHDKKRLPYEILCERFGVKNVWAGWESQHYLTSNYIDLYFNSAHKLPSLGYGSKQLLTIITQLAYSEPGSVVLIEEPEISLHPRYQCMLPILFGRAVNEGKQILVTTHSSYLPLSLDIVLEGYRLEGQTTRGWGSYEVKLSTSDIIVYEVTRDEKDGCTKVERLELDEKGLKKGVPSFVNVERQILKRIIGE